MVKKVIGFYPGGGGNRYLRYLLGEEFRSPGISYDFFIKNQSFSWRYLLDDEIICHNDTVLTHCVNQSHIRKKLGNVSKITLLNFPMKDCLCREWMINGRNRYLKKNQLGYSDLDKKIECYHAIYSPGWPAVKNAKDYMSLPCEIKKEVDENFVTVVESHNRNIDVQSAIETIKWHKDYYEKFPFNADSSCQVINLSDDSEFSSLMRCELNLYHSQIFDYGWRTIYG